MEALRLHETVIFLCAAGLVVPVAKHWRLSPILAFLLIGLAVGPFGLARLADDLPWLSYVLITDVDGVRALAELGVIFLLFMIGIELSFDRLARMRRLVFGLGTLQIVVTGAVVALIARAFGNSIEASIVLGACLALSSTAIVIQLLTEQGRFGSALGQGVFAILLAQDIAVVPILFLLGALGAGSETSLTTTLVFAIGQALISVVLIVGIGRVALRPIFRFVGNAQSPELFMAVTLLTVIAASAATHAAGLSAALGAFLAGLLLSESEYRHEIEVNIEPFKGLLLGLFFMSVAMGIDLFAVWADFFWVIMSVFGLIAVKAVVVTLLARGFGIRWASAVEMGLLLGQGGEFAFVVVGLALTLGVMPPSTGQFMLIVASMTMFLTPAIARIGRQISVAMERGSGAEAPLDDPELDAELQSHVIIVGYGRTGQLLARLLDRQQVPHVALDLDPARVTRLRAEGAPVVLADASRSATLAKVSLPRAAAIAVCTDDPNATQLVLAAARRTAPHVPVVARAHDNRHAAQLLVLGADEVVPEILESGLQLGQVMLERIGLTVGAAHELVEFQRTEEMRDLREGGEGERIPDPEPRSGA